MEINAHDNRYWVCGRSWNSSAPFYSLEEIADSVRLGETPLGGRGLVVKQFVEVEPLPLRKKIGHVGLGAMVGYLFYNTVGIGLFGLPPSPVGSVVAAVAVAALSLSNVQAQDRPAEVERGRLTLSRGRRGPEAGHLCYQATTDGLLARGVGPVRDLGPAAP